ncbi:beta-N-acetylhexosaminidase [Dokdonia ponticola]|uniref:beta-N-acetylhexosaminidase n=1 Tax=Dokdonia ponticola TaxID=2041041 RepID=A0ABV9HYM5_9FLAO
MKKYSLHSLLILFFSFCTLSCSNEWKEYQNAASDYQIIPKPLSLETSQGRFLVDEKTIIVGDVSLTNEINYVSDMLQVGSRFTVSTSNDSANEKKKNSITLLLDESLPSDESYKLEVTFDNVVISGKTPAGIFYGIQSLRQLLPATVESESTNKVPLTIPAVLIEDQPTYVYRGMHLDVGRHFFPVDFIKKYIDLIAMHKMNTFHWHLTEDQGWRIEIKKYPKLTEIGSQRKETILEKNFNPYIGDGKPYGGFYTQEEVKEIVAYATSRHITVIPEIELPGHSLAAIASYPELGNTGQTHEVGTRWGVYDQIYAPKEDTFAFLEDVLTEVIALFPSKLIHIGGDEAPKKEWKESNYAQELIKREGLKDEHELQSYFIKRIEKFLNSKGRDIIGWDEILEGGLAPNATVMSWRGIQGGIDAARMQHNVIMTPGSHCYFDHYQVDKEAQSEEPLAIGGYTSVEKVYSYQPTPEELSPDLQKYILGAQGNVWTEYILDGGHVEYMVLPRMTALSEVLWTSPASKNWDDFKVRLQHFKKRYDVMELNYAPHVFVQTHN